LFVGVFSVITFCLCSHKQITNSAGNLQSRDITKLNSRTEINWIGQWVGEGDKEKFIRELANEYEFRNQEVKVNLKFKDDLYKEESETDFILTQIQKPVADYDILVRVHIHYHAIAEKLHDNNWGEKYLIDFSKMPDFMDSHKPFIHSKLYSGQYGQMHFGPYNEGQLAALFVNTEVAKKMGISVKQFGMTFDDFMGYLKTANEYNKTHPNIIPLFDDNWNKAETIFIYLFYSLLNNYDQIQDPKLTSEKLTAIEKCYVACEELSKYHPIERNRQSRVWEHTNQFPLVDSCLFYPNFTFMYNIWKLKGKEKIHKLIPCEYPVFKQSSVCIGGYVSNWAVLKNAPHKEAAIKLMKYWCQPDIAEKWVRYTKCPSGVKGNLTENTFGADPFENYVFTMEKKYDGKMVQDVDKQFIVGEKNRSVDLHAVEVLEGKLSAKDAFNALKKKLVKI